VNRASWPSLRTAQTVAPLPVATTLKPTSHVSQTESLRRQSSPLRLIASTKLAVQHRDLIDIGRLFGPILLGPVVGFEVAPNSSAIALPILERADARGVLAV
jgi:hypothetical protein